MSRKPIDQQQPHECRQAIWEEIKTKSDWTFAAADLDVKLDASSIREYLISLAKGGYLEVVSRGKRGEANLYRLINDCGVDAPRLRKDGTPVTQGRGRYQMWRAMQAVKAFTPAQLANYASIEEHEVAVGEAASYCRELCKAGYLSRRDNGYYLFIPSMWTGPHPPQIQRTKQVYDPNLRRVVWAKVEGGAE